VVTLKIIALRDYRGRVNHSFGLDYNFAMTLPVTVALLAGGKSSRMGTDKAFVRVLGRPLIEDILAQVDGLGAETLIVTNRPDDYRYLGLPLFGDVLPDKGALGGI
jgi:molybdopterin-guanine dinucleotide biosynthesis protein A